MNYEIHLEEKFKRRVERLTQIHKDDFATPLRGLILVLRSEPHFGKLASDKDNLWVVPFSTAIKGDHYRLFYTFDGKVIKLRSVSGAR